MVRIAEADNLSNAPGSLDFQSFRGRFCPLFTALRADGNRFSENRDGVRFFPAGIADGRFRYAVRCRDGRPDAQRFSDFAQRKI